MTTLMLAAALVWQEPDLAAEAAKLEKTVLSEDVSATKEIRTALLKQLAAGPASPGAPMLRYTIAYADWRLSFSSKIAETEQNGLLADAEAHLNQALKANPQFAEAYVLLASVYGAQIGHNADLGMTLGPSSDAMMRRAEALDASNPRLWLLRGLLLFHTPAEYGGDRKQAEAEFRKAIQALSSAEGAGKGWPSWGLFDAHAWLGQTLLARGDKAGARAEYAAALAIAPDSGWVKYVLMPQAKQP